MSPLPIAGILILIVVIFLHSVCIDLLRKTPCVPQREILINLAATEILTSIWDITYWLTVLLGKDTSNLHEKYQVFIITYDLIFYLTMFLFLTDRFASIYYHLRYQSLILKRKIKLVILVLWIVAVIAGICAVLLSDAMQYSAMQVHTVKVLYLYFPLNILIIVLLIGVYTYFFMVKKRLESNAGNKTALLAPFLILTTFILFIAVPDGISLLQYIMYKFSLLLYSLDYLTDALFILLVNSELRDQTRRLFKRILLDSEISRREPRIVFDSEI